MSESFYKPAAAVISGALLATAFPLLEWFWLAWVALVPLLLILDGTKGSTRLRLGMLAGLAHHGIVLYWLVPFLHTFGPFPWLLAIAICFLLVAFLSLFWAVFCLLTPLFYRRPLVCLLMTPALWVGLEYLRTFFLTGFPWELLGYSQFRQLHLIQISDIFGVYGVSFLLVLGNTAVFLLLYRPQAGGKPASRRTGRAAAVLVTAGIIALVWWYGQERIAQVGALSADRPTRRIAAVQGNIDQKIKWNPAFQEATTSDYIKLSRDAAAQNADLIVWPETATPFYFLHEETLTRQILAAVQTSGADFIIGSNAVQRSGDRISFFNSAYLISSRAKVLGRYDKSHLVPFGEYTPLKRWIPFVGKMTAHAGDFEPGKRRTPLNWQGHPLGVQICYELIFPRLAREAVRHGAELLVNITNDAWYGKTSAPYQHFSMAVFRAVETRKSLVRAANTGISGFIDPVGRILAATPIFQPAAPTRSVPLLDIHSVYVRYGDLLGRVCLAVLTAAFLGWTFTEIRNRRHA